MRALALALALVALPCAAALEEWSCPGLADFYGYVAVDRDAGVSSKDRNNKTVRDIITVVDSEWGVEVAAEDAQALLQIVRYVYWHRGTAYQIRREALLSCMRGQREPPAARPSSSRGT